MCQDINGIKNNLKQAVMMAVLTKRKGKGQTTVSLLYVFFWSITKSSEDFDTCQRYRTNNFSVQQGTGSGSPWYSCTVVASLGTSPSCSSSARSVTLVTSELRISWIHSQISVFKEWTDFCLFNKLHRKKCDQTHDQCAHLGFSCQKM